ncbi:hypothetical protein ACNQR7_07745 [Mycolicibacterium senegalense]|uniref:hypothetical protein n=1 Tax=Mycolicibacterium senegalense TaxID=1796 RepID=UPI003AB08BCE
MTTNQEAPEAQMRAAVEARYRLDHPDDTDGALVAGWLAAQRVAARSGGYATMSAEVEVATCRVDARRIETWLDEAWGDIAGTLTAVIA